MRARVCECVVGVYVYEWSLASKRVILNAKVVRPLHFISRCTAVNLKIATCCLRVEFSLVSTRNLRASAAAAWTSLGNNALCVCMSVCVCVCVSGCVCLRVRARVRVTWMVYVYSDVVT